MKIISNEKQRKIGIGLSYIHTALSAIISLAYIPILLQCIGQSEYGLYQLLGSVIAYFSTMYSSLNSSVMKYYTQYLIAGDEKKMENTLAISRSIFALVSIVIVAVAIPVSAIFGYAYKNVLTVHEMHESLVMFVVMIVNILVYLNNSIYSASIMSHERFIFRRSLDVLAQIMQPIVVVLFIQKYPYALTIVVIQLLLNCIVAFANVVYSKKRLHIRIVYHGRDHELVRGLLSLSGAVLFVALADQIFWKTDQIILGQLYGTGVVAVYSIGAQLSTIYISVGIVMASVMLPQFTRIISQDRDGTKVSAMFTQLGRYQSFVVMLAMTGIILFGKEFIILLAGEDYLGGYVVAMLLIIPYTVDLIQNSGNTILQAQNKYWYRAKILFVAAIVNVFLTYFLARRYGMYGAAAATTISILITSGFIMNYIYAKKMKLNIGLFWREVGPVWILGIFPFLIGFLIRQIELSNRYIQFVVHVLLYVIIYICFVWKVVMKKKERDYLAGRLPRYQSEKRKNYDKELPV